MRANILDFPNDKLVELLKLPKGTVITDVRRDPEKLITMVTVLGESYDEVYDHSSILHICQKDVFGDNVIEIEDSLEKTALLLINRSKIIYAIMRRMINGFNGKSFDIKAIKEFLDEVGRRDYDQLDEIHKELFGVNYNGKMEILHA